MASQGWEEVKTRRQVKHRARARQARWIRDGRPRRLEKGLSAALLADIATRPGEVGSADSICQTLAHRRRSRLMEEAAAKLDLEREMTIRGQQYVRDHGGQHHGS